MRVATLVPPGVVILVMISMMLCDDRLRNKRDSSEENVYRRASTRNTRRNRNNRNNRNRNVNGNGGVPANPTNAVSNGNGGVPANVTGDGNGDVNGNVNSNGNVDIKFDVLRYIIQAAVRHVEIEDKYLDLREIVGIDKKIEEYTTVEPILFSESPLDVTKFSRPSRIMNWISTLLRDAAITIPVETALLHEEAVLREISCPFKSPICNFNAKYRTLDGTCNNENRPLIGSAFTPFKREMAPVYEKTPGGKTDLPRKTGAAGGPLPSARLVTTTVHAFRETSHDESIWNMQFSFWGQMIAHDITDRAPSKGYMGAMLSCCDQRIKTQACFNIPVPDGDVFQTRNTTCLSFARSVEVTDIDCKLGGREQLNQASSYIDAGFVYGITESKSQSLRTGSGGLLATSVNDQLPIFPHPNAQARLQGFAFFAAGDDRVNEYVGLIGIETVWVREHNRIAKILASLNPEWNDETSYQETRRIVIAMVQHITYNEYLPETVGADIMTSFDLRPMPSGYYKGYQSSVDPSASNVFVTAALRFGHSMVRPTLSLTDRSFNHMDSPAMTLKHLFFTSTTFLQNEQPMMRGAMVDKSEPCDRMVNADILNNLHQTRNGNGGDLAAFNIQRGRDHGLNSYSAWRRYYGFPEVKVFTNETNGFDEHSQETVELLQKVYSSPEDVDIWTGGVSETPRTRTAVGPLFAHILARQFRALKKGDRYFYESDAQPEPFTTDQLQQIRKVTLANVLCKNLQLNTIQPRAFVVSSEPGNERIRCASVPSMDFTPWRGTNTTR